MKTDMLSRVIDFWFNDHYAEMINVLARLVEIPSVAGTPSENEPNGRGPLLALATMAQIMKEYGFEIENHGNSVVTAEMNENDAVLGIAAHLDVVEAGEGWETDPFSLKLRGGKLYGRGVMDDKGPAVAALFAVRAAKDIYPKMTKGCRLIFGSSEETGSADIKAYMKECKMPPNVFTPDANFPVINLEKGMYCPTIKASWKKEDKGARVISLSGGTVHNRVPEKATAVIAGITAAQATEYCAGIDGVTFEVTEEGKNVSITCSGKSAHAANPELGFNAQTALIKAVCGMPLTGEGFKYLCALNELLPYGDTEGKALGIAMSDEQSGALTLNFGVLAMTEEGLTANFDSRVPMCGNDENVRAATEKALSDRGFTVSGEMVPCHYTPEDSDFVKTLLSVYEDYTDKKGECIAIGGGTYVHGIEGGVAFGCEMPGVDHCIHGANEWVSLEDLILSAKIFTRVICEMCM